MKTKYPSMFGILAMLMLVASLVIPANLVSPSKVEADPGICKWDTIREPGSLPGTMALAPATEPIDIAIGSDGKTVVVVYTMAQPALPTGSLNLFIYSDSGGIFWTATRWTALIREPQWTPGVFRNVYNVAMAPDNPKVFAVTTDAAWPAGFAAGPREVWITTDGGSTWEITNLALPAGETIRTIDFSIDYGGKRDIAVGTATGAGGGRLIVLKSVGFTGWIVQVNPIAGIDYFAVKLSPTYAGDASLAVVFAGCVFPALPMPPFSTSGCAI